MVFSKNGEWSRLADTVSYLLPLEKLTPLPYS